MKDLIKFFFAGDDDRASGRKIITYVCAAGLAVMFVKVLMGTASPEIAENARTIVSLVIGFYFGKRNGNHKL